MNTTLQVVVMQGQLDIICNTGGTRGLRFHNLLKFVHGALPRVNQSPLLPSFIVDVDE